tara:strand:- start:387 stop:695 length:309 start_codon:yes stop_codon:yes gene_type:complete
MSNDFNKTSGHNLRIDSKEAKSLFLQSIEEKYPEFVDKVRSEIIETSKQGEFTITVRLKADEFNLSKTVQTQISQYYSMLGYNGIGFRLSGPSGMYFYLSWK